MKHTFLKTVAVGVLALGMASCADELNISPIDPNSSSTYDPTELLAKQYAVLAVTGQTGPDGNGDISGDEGETGFWRVIFNLQELPTDEVIWAWQNDEDIPAITNIAWNASSTRVNWAYQRLAYNITLFNQYLAEQTGVADEKYIAEVRFLRALHYSIYLDLFHAAPFKIDFNFTELPTYKNGEELYAWLDQELTELEGLLAPVGEFNGNDNFGRADQGAAYALHARLALNAYTYTDGKVKDYQKAVDYATKVINSGKYALSTEAKNGFSGYAQVFMGDNDTNASARKEIIFPIRQDGVRTQGHVGATYLVSSMRVAGMPYSGTNNYWSCNFSREDLVKKFFSDTSKCPAATQEKLDSYLEKHPDVDGNNMTEADIIDVDDAIGGSTQSIVSAAGDDRALFYAGVGGGIRTVNPGKQITGFLNGYSIVKWQNLHSDLSETSHAQHSDTDIPMFRLAEMYLTRAEALTRMGQAKQALDDVNIIRRRANAEPCASVTLDILCDEWGREFFVEGRRRSDLVRFNRFTSSSYLWNFKGGMAAGTGVDKHYNVYPFPTDEVLGNPALKQNKGY